MHLMHKVFRDLLDRGVVIFLDDILIYSKTAEEHETLLREVFTRLRQHHLYAKESKCELWRTEVTFLGHVINQHGVSMEACKDEAISHGGRGPNDPSRYPLVSWVLQALIGGLSGTFARIAAPLTDLLLKDAKIRVDR